MIKYLFLGLVIWFMYRFWDTKKAPVEEKEPELLYDESEEFTDYEELD